MRPRTFHFSERVSFRAARYPEHIALSPLRPRSGATSLSSFGGTRFHVAGGNGNPRSGARSVSFRARARRDWASFESFVPGRSGSRKARTYGDRARHAADVRGFRRRETGGAHFWKTERTQGAGPRRGND